MFFNYRFIIAAFLILFSYAYAMFKIYFVIVPLRYLKNYIHTLFNQTYSRIHAICSAGLYYTFLIRLLEFT